MSNSTPPQWLKELQSHDKDKYAIATALRHLILKDEPVTEEIKYGGLLYSNATSYTGIFVYKNHVTLEFTNGNKLADPDGLLSGSGKYRRHITFSSVEDIDEQALRVLLGEASKAAKQTKE
jgi:hypothetical protein